MAETLVGRRRLGNSVLGGVGLVLAIIGLFFLPFWMGSLAILFGIIDQVSPKRGLGIAAIIIGLIDIIFPLFLLALFV